MGKAVTYREGKKCKECGKAIPDQSRRWSYCHDSCSRKRLARIAMRKPIKAVHRSSRAYKDIAINEQGSKCVLCSWFLAFLRNNGLDVHHIHAVVDGGTNEQENLVALCPNCHRAAEAGFYTDADLRTARKDAIRRTKQAGPSEDVKRITAGLRFGPTQDVSHGD